MVYGFKDGGLIADITQVECIGAREMRRVNVLRTVIKDNRVMARCMQPFAHVPADESITASDQNFQRFTAFLMGIMETPPPLSRLIRTAPIFFIEPAGFICLNRA